MLTWTSSSTYLLLVSSVVAQTYLPNTAPDKTNDLQTGTNKCGTGTNQTSLCQNVYFNSVTDFCLWGPPNPGPDSKLGTVERSTVSYCLKPGYGTRIIPDGTMTGVHFVKTPDFVQITGAGDFTKILVPAGDEGGELDPHGADGEGNPAGGLVFSNAFGAMQQIPEWTSFISDKEFCFRACKPGPKAVQWCQHMYDTMGCSWNMPGNYEAGKFEQCAADSGEPMGIYGTSTYQRAASPTPSAHPVPPSSSCTPSATIGNGLIVSGTVIVPTTTSKASTTTSSAKVTGAAKTGKTSTSAPTATGSSAAVSTFRLGGEGALLITGWSVVLGFIGGSILVL